MTDKIIEPLNLRPGSGMLFKNRNKKEGDNRPEYVGEVEIPAGMQGRKEISLWKKTSQAGKPYLSLRVSDPWKPTRKEAPAKPAYAPKSPPVQRDPDFDDDLPF